MTRTASALKAADKAAKPEPEIQVDPEKNVPPVTMTKRADGSFSISVDRAEIAPEKARRPYWVGVLPTCGYQNVHVGGIALPRWTGVFNFGEDGQPIGGAAKRGAIAHLSEDELQGVLEGVKRRVLRPVGGIDALGRQRHQMFVVDGKAYRPGPADLPLADFLYVVDADTMTYGDRETWPPSLTD